MKPLLVATTNPAKLEEYRLLLGGYALAPVSLREAGIVGEAPEETGETFAENALLKARFYFARAGMPTIADDGGLMVDALGGAPGIRSHRWLGEHPGLAYDEVDRALASEVVRRMAGVDPSRRTARLCAAAALVYRDGGSVRERVSEAALEGFIAQRVWPRMRAGFPYRAVLFLPDRGCYLGELSDEDAARVSQRRIALERLSPELHRISISSEAP